MNLGSMKTDIRERLGEALPDFWSDEFITQKINDGVTRFSTEMAWPWLVTLATAGVSAGEETLTLNTGIAFSRQFNLTYTIPPAAVPHTPRRVTPAEGFRLAAENYAEGQPMWYYLVSTLSEEESGKRNISTAVRLIPTPKDDITVSIQYLRVPAPLVDDTDVPDIPEEWQEAPVAWATGMLWLRELNGGPKAQEQFNIYNAVLQQAQADAKTQTTDEQVIWGGGEPRNRPHRRLPRPPWPPQLGP